MKVAILGMGPSADTYARHAAGSGDVRKVFDEVWTVNAFGSVFKADRLFHMDDIRIQQIRAEGGNTQIAGLIDYLQRAPGPIYTSRVLPKEPNPQYEIIEEALAKLEGDGAVIEKYRCTEREYLEGVMRWLKAERTLQKRGGFEGLVPYPICEVLNGSDGIPYYTSTVPYAIAMALAGKAAGLPEDVTMIAPFGVDYSHVNVVKAELGRACCEFWLGMCKAKGIELHLPEDTWLLGTNTRNRLYGYDTQAISFVRDENGGLAMVFKDKPAPTAEEIERAYCFTHPQKVAA